MPKSNELPEDPRIPREYRRSGLRKVTTVGELIEHLQKLPADLPMSGGISGPVDVYVSKSMGRVDKFVCMIDDWEGDDESDE